MARKGGVKAMGSAGIGADGLHTDTDDRCLCGQPARALDRDARRVRPGGVGVKKPLLIARSRVPARPVEKPAAVWQRAMFSLPLLDVGDLEQVIGVEEWQREHGPLPDGG